MNTYGAYMTCEKAVPVEQMEEILDAIIDEITGDPDAEELYEDLVAASIDYAAIRAEWALMDREKKMDKDPVRTSLHNRVILHLNMLARYLRQSGKPANWRDRLGSEEEDRIYRKVMGDFGCYLAFVNSLCER